MIDAPRMRAARALLSWSQEDLAERSGITQATVANIEVGKHRPSSTTLQRLIESFHGAGIEFLPDGVRLLESVRVYSGKDAGVRLFDDVYYTLRETGGELLIGGADERQTREGVISAVRRIRDLGVRMRVLVEENNRHLMAPLEEYRWVPSTYFKNTPHMIYGDRVAIALPVESIDVVHIFINRILADSQRRLFNFVWDNCVPPDSSEIDQVYSSLRAAV